MIQQGATVGARLEKMGQAWRRVRPYLPGFLVVLVVAGAILALYFIPKMQVSVCPTEKEAQAAKLCFDMENEARRTLYYIMGGLLAVIGIVLTFRRIRALERQVLVAQEGQITERFTRAIEQLGSDKMEIRLGGIYALERIANDSDKDYWPIMETLTAYVRERAPMREILPGSEEVSFGPLPLHKPATDIQAILTVLGRRKYRYGQGENQRLDLGHTDLRGADLFEAHLEGSYLNEAHMERSYLCNAYLEGANLRGTYLRRAILAEARMEKAALDGAHLEGASLIRAHMQEAELFDAHLEGAKLFGTHLEWARLGRTHLEGADLRYALGLTMEQLVDAILDDKTRLPDYLQEKPPAAKGPQGNDEA